MHHKGGDRVKPTFLAAVAFSKRSSRAFSFRFLFLRRVSGTSMSYQGGHCQNKTGRRQIAMHAHSDGWDTMVRFTQVNITPQ
jgi:hypothetical protein